ncbi:helix-turn-helix domain-containing protein [Rhizobium herbae]|uniref:AraC-like DNA-binding protein n=1 Tax=Rhizobium herbae TaxID=508661 RepID=A0ABS4EQA5_9HYPH|nr:AraC family transcriptional regulator [Rhizobium herbae]MBP1859986.1 AraC-like DNA-binding protein [Rhizobium herbae]
MPFVPLPFVVAILLIILFVTVVRRDDGAQANGPFLALILLSVFQSLLSGLRWGYGVQEVMYLAPVGAATVPPLAYAGVTALVRKNSKPLLQRLGLHAVPALVIVVLLVAWRGAIDVALVLISVGYAVAILLLMRPGTDALRLAPFEGAAPAYRAILFAALALLFSAAVDTFVSLDLAWTHGAYTRPVIAIGNLASLIILSVAAAAASKSHTPVETEDASPGPDLAEDRETIAAVQALMQTRRVYRDVDLNLDRLARKLGIPARQISAAINRASGKNVSQYVNEYRITEACGLLAETEKPVTEIMFEVGFQTKSNFNREFRRVTEMTPLEWRERTARPS